VAEVAHAKHPESKACCSREFQGMFARDGPGDECGGKDGVKESAMVWTGRGFQDVREQTQRVRSDWHARIRKRVSIPYFCGWSPTQPRSAGESACACAEEEFAPIKWSVVVHRHFGGLDKDVDGRADNCSSYEMCFSVWHNHFRFLREGCPEFSIFDFRFSIKQKS